MSSIDKLIKKLENNPKNASFDDIKRILLKYGYVLDHVKGSHHKFKKGSDSIVVPYHKPIKDIYVLQILAKIKEI
ncbi:type II toxin-antitoxin system HicA family toxin [Campylobacter sputorum]|uniref:type II toxin-antitoxin system HicA family toxin n=1 Tax=Campylobacter sputorum TaxID=206 RepID=UPI00053BE35C|nr:type II toxin-antitoxin system HicA family toxin [Campylobacter sputorum]